MVSVIKSAMAASSAFALALAVPVGTAVAQDGDVVITNTETVNASLDPSGNVDVVRVYDQIALQGSGTVSYRNPVSTAALRNLDGFGGFTVEDGAIVEETTVDSQIRRRTVSDFELDLPVSVAVTYRLDGQEISPADLVGKSGEVEVTYRIENMTGQPEEISVLDANGRFVTETVDVYDPLVGSLSFTLPSNYTDVVSDGGFVTAGDGRGGTLMTANITLISGLTDPVLEASYTAVVTNAVVPPASMSIIPVLVEENPSTAAQLEALQGGADTGRDLASGAGLIDGQLLRLADGAGDLVNGLILLREGSAELSAGLVNTAAPGANQLAAGAGELAAGLNGTAVPGSQELAAGASELAAGLNGTAVPGSQELAAGASELAAGLNGTAVPGANDLAGGARQVADGAASLQAGLDDLAKGVDALPAQVKAELENNPDYQDLLGGLDQLIEGLRATGTTDCEKGLLGVDPTNCGAMDAVQLVAGLLGDAAAPGGDIDQLIQASIAVYQQAVSVVPPTTGAGCPENPGTPIPPVVPPSNLVSAGFNQNDICVLQSNVVYGLGLPARVLSSTDPGGLKAQTAAASAALVEVYEGVDAEAIPGLEAIKAGIPQLVDAILASIEQQLLAAIGNATPGCEPEVGKGGLRCGAAALADGAKQVADGAETLAGGLQDAGSGSQQLADGAGQLADGLGDAGDGANQVADGAGRLSSGLVEAGDGSNQLADGAGQLADGLGDAADGSVQIASGLDDAAEAAPAIPAGAQRLSEEGTSQIVASGADTVLTFGQRVAVLKASADRTADGGLPFGAPDGAIVAAAYRYDLAAANGATAQNTGQIVAGAVIAGGAIAGAGVLARRRAS